MKIGMTTATPSASPDRAPRMRVARGPKRPDYMGNPDHDRFMMMFTALMGEVSALRDRLDTHELLAAANTVATPEAIDNFALSPEDVARRSGMRDAMLHRVFRILMEELELAERGVGDAGADVDYQEDGCAR